jgi:hypothetical protein
MPKKPASTPEFNCTQRHKGPPPRYQRVTQGRPLWDLSKDFWRSLQLRPSLGPSSKSGTRPPAHTCRRNLRARQSSIALKGTRGHRRDATLPPSPPAQPESVSELLASRAPARLVVRSAQLFTSSSPSTGLSPAAASPPATSSASVFSSLVVCPRLSPAAAGPPAASPAAVFLP